MEEAPITGSTKPVGSWQDRAIKAPTSLPASVPRMPPPLSKEALAEATQVLGRIFQKLVDEATLVSALKFQEIAAKKRAERRTAEYEKSKHYHDKYPSIKETQTASKAEAEKELRTISEKVSQKHASLNGFAFEAVEKLIPNLLAHGGGNSAEQENLQKRVDRIEKTIEDQGTLIEEQHRAFQTLTEKHTALDRKHTDLGKDSEEKHLDLIKQLRITQGQASSTQQRLMDDMGTVDTLLQNVKESAQAIETLKTDLSSTKGDIARISTDNIRLSSDLKEKVLKIDTISNLGKDIVNLRKDLKNIETTSKAAQDAEEQFKTLSENIGKVRDQSFGLVTHVTDLATAQKQFRDTYAGLESRVDEIAKRADPSTFKTRLQKLEQDASALRDAKDSVTKKDLDTLKDRVKQIEQAPPPPPAQHLLPAKTNSKSLDLRVEALEKAAQTPLPAKRNSKALDTRVEALEKWANSRTTHDTNVEERLKGVEIGVSSLQSTDFADLKKRMSAVESQQRHASSTLAPAATPAPKPQISSDNSANVQPQFNEISAQIQTMQKNLEEIKDAQEVHDETWTSVLDEQIEEKSQKLQARISLLEATSSQLSNRLEKLPQLATTLDERQMASLVNEATTNVVAIFKDKPELLPFPNVERTTFVLNQALVPMHNSIEGLKTSHEATNFSLGNLQSRVDNINTLDLSKHALGQLYELHPDLQKIEALMIGFRADLAGYKTDIQTKNSQIEELSNKVNALQGAVQNLEANIQDRQTAESMSQQYRDLRKEVGSLTDDGNNMSRRVKAIATELENVAKGVADLQQENEGNKQVIADKFAQLQDDADEKMDKSSEAQRPESQRPEALPRPSPAVSQRSSSTQNGVNVNRGPKPSFSTGNRQASTSSINKKRKLDNATSAKTNGVRPGSSSRSPQAKKRQRRAFGDDDPQADPDYNEEIPEPGVSSDEE
jgi:DNA repair exonuclease SbcCD ATPase subunit